MSTLSIPPPTPPSRREVLLWTVVSGAAAALLTGGLTLWFMSESTADATPAASARPETRPAVQITMYTTPWCPHCDRARKWFASQGIAYTERDTERDPSAVSELRRLNPAGGVPTIDVGGQVLVGFNPQAVQQALRSARQPSTR